MRFTYEGIIHSGSDSDLLAGILAPQREGALRVEKMSGLLYIAFARQAPAEHFPTHAPKTSPGFIAPELRKASISHQSLVSERETCPGQISKAD